MPIPRASVLQEVRRSLWPEQAAQPAFIHHLRSLYDETQLEAIEVGWAGASAGSLSASWLEVRL